MRLTDDTLRALPKTDLHCHLDGSVRIATIGELARAQGEAVGTLSDAELARRLHVGETCESLEHYLLAFEVTLSVLQTADGLRRAARELAEDAVAEGVWYLEVRFSPILHLQQGLTAAEALVAVLEGLAEAEARWPIRTGVIVCAIRNLGPEVGVALAQLAVEFKHRGVRGFDLAGGELGFAASAHRRAFEIVRDAELARTVHAGEGDGAASIREALYHCGAQRIGHGCRLFEDPSLLEYVNDHRIPLEVCPTSNEQTRAVPSVAEHPVALYVARGLAVTINTDNRLMSGTTVTRELGRLVREVGLDEQAVRRVLLDGFDAAFLPWSEKITLRERARDEIDRVLAAAGAAP